MECSVTYQFKTKPFKHQLDEFKKHLHTTARGILWEQGTGKTKLVIDETCALFELDEIDALFVLAPPGVHLNWITDELPAHVPDHILTNLRSHVWQTSKTGTKWHAKALDDLVKHEGLAVLTMSFDGFMTEKGKEAAWRFLRRRRAMYVVDEGHNIKTPKAKRTQSVVKSAKYAPFRRLLTGTPIAVGPFDIYSQLRFVDESIWKRIGLENFSAFKFHFGEWYTAAEHQRDHGYDPGFDKFIAFKNMDELYNIVHSVSSRVTKESAGLNLPPKLYSKRYFELNGEQARVYRELKEEFLSEFEDGKVVEGQLAIVRLLRLQQVACGYAHVGDDEPTRLLGNHNPLLDQLLEVTEGLGHQAIVWARFTKDIDQLMDALPGAVRYDGKMTDDECARNKAAFQAGDAQFFVGNQAKGKEGLTLIGAKSTLYYSNSFKLIDRLQSEDRNHRIGQDEPVNYYDFEGRLPDGSPTVTRHIINALRRKFDIASQITGDELREWI